jgi:hypothetical protein
VAETRRFPPPWTVDRPHPDSFVVKDANGLVVATVHCRDDLQKWSFGHGKLTSEEARKIAKATPAENPLVASLENCVLARLRSDEVI